MKHFSVRFSRIGIALVLLMLLAIKPVLADESFSAYYISISDSIMETKKGNDAGALTALETFQKNWQSRDVTDEQAAKNVESKLQAAVGAKNSEARLKALTNLSKALQELENAENPKDEKADREAFAKAVQPSLLALEKAIQEGQPTAIEQAYNNFNSTWTKNEGAVRDQSIASYGEIETQLSFFRISLAEDEVDLDKLNTQFTQLSEAIQNFNIGKDPVSAKKEYSLSTLIGLLDKASTQAEKESYEEASSLLREFIVVWPNVEGEIRTKNSSLYTKIENDVPLLVSNLNADTVNSVETVKKIDDFKQQLALLKGEVSYSFWDSALILLREGLEALLIIIALIAFLKKAGQQDMQKWIYAGAFAGILLSAVAAILMSTLFQSVSIGTNRETMEGIVGLAAAAMMIGVGVWLHNKSTARSWNKYISKQLGNAISQQSVMAMAFISFLSVFREGAETLVFYAGIAPKMSKFEFSFGIFIALVILSITAFVLLKASVKIPVHKFFAVATLLIYVLAFKIIGVSIHTLQLTDTFSLSVLNGLPIVNAIGFFPTIETITGQLVLIFLIAFTVFYKKRNRNTVS